jgi:transcription elongation factor Elf1
LQQSHHLFQVDKVATLACRACKITWKTKIANVKRDATATRSSHSFAPQLLISLPQLTHQVDVYARWVDAFMELQADPTLATGGDAAGEMPLRLQPRIFRKDYWKSVAMRDVAVVRLV